MSDVIPRAQAHSAATTAAFMVMGFPRDDGPDSTMSRLLDAWGQGCLELVSEMTQYALYSEELLAARKDQDFPGVYDYEVSESFGAWFAAYVRVHPRHAAPPVDQARRVLEGMVGKFFKQAESRPL